MSVNGSSNWTVTPFKLYWTIINAEIAVDIFIELKPRI